LSRRGEARRGSLEGIEVEIGRLIRGGLVLAKHAGRQVVGKIAGSGGRIELSSEALRLAAVQRRVLVEENGNLRDAEGAR
jgi:hypothetical protein